MNAMTPEQREIVTRLQSGRLMICEGQGDPNSDGCGGQGYTGAAGQEPCPHCYGAGVMTPELRVALASAPSPEAGAGGDLGELERLIENYGEAQRTHGMGCAISGYHSPTAREKAKHDLIEFIRSGKLVASTGSGKEETKGADDDAGETTEALVARLEAELGVKGINSVFRRALAIAKEASADAKLRALQADADEATAGDTWAQVDPPMTVEEAKPCHWGGGNDIIWCSTCGAEYAYAKGEERPACPRLQDAVEVR